MEAIRKIVPISSKLRDHLDEKEDELNACEKLRNCITSWGLRKKKAENREQASMDMDVGSVGWGKGINSARNMEEAYYDPWDGQIFSMTPVTSDFSPEEVCRVCVELLASGRLQLPETVHARDLEVAELVALVSAREEFVSLGRHLVEAGGV